MLYLIISFLAILPPQIPFKCQQWWRKRQIILPFCYSELPRLAIHYSKVVLKKKKKKITLPFFWVWWQRGSEEKINEKINSVWLRVKIRPLM